MAARVYATQEQYRAWSGDETATVSDALLTRASMQVDLILRGAVYDVNDQSMPTNVDVIQALQDATCAQIQWWDELGDTTGAGAASQFQSAALGSASYTKGYSSAGSNAGNGSGLSPTAFQILEVAGLLPFGVWVCG